MVVHCNNNECRKFLAMIFSFCPNMKYIDLGMDRIMLLCMPCSFLWRKITFHHSFNQLPINALLTAIKTEFLGLDDLIKNQFRGRVWPLLQVIVILVWISNPKNSVTINDYFKEPIQGLRQWSLPCNWPKRQFFSSIQIEINHLFRFTHQNLLTPL